VSSVGEGQEAGLAGLAEAGRYGLIPYPSQRSSGKGDILHKGDYSIVVYLIHRQIRRAKQDE